MERLLYSSSPTQLKFLPLKPRMLRSDSPKLGLFPLSRPDFKRFSPISCKNDNPSQFGYSSSSKLKILKSISFSRDDSPNEKTPSAPSFKQIAASAVEPKKGIAAGTFVALSAIIVLLIHPVFVPAAFATFQTAAKTTGPAAATAGGKLLRNELLSSAWTGFFAGCLHTLSGPDHLAALAPLSIGRTRLESAAVGALWGCGHDAGQVIFGLLFLLLKDRLHIEIIRNWGTKVVGLTLLAIGVMGIKEASEVPTPCVALENGECDVSVYESLENPAVVKKKIGLATFATGIVHGFQPDALMIILPALALPSRLAGTAFLIMFLLGTVVAMGSYTVFLGSCSRALKDRVPRITEKLTWAASILAMALGVAILISQFFGYSLY
ncbi:uncharacterized protein LOC123213921 isoform X2 [Mangifera indica]|uniref:uncharacterized protein LOC123213921 isoform X2 n=1 Tax=Mangifera indica TaxID=29780 RepID=UPI001CFBE1BA|nr:uncharacterized protein LOC123213921 isoform X2 [Mangifera indica]